MIKIRVRVAAIIKLNNGYCFIHRKGVKKNKDYSEYYTLPGGGVEKGETLEQAIIREIKEELGINVKPLKIIFQNEQEKFNQKEVYFLCDYIDGTFGTGDGPEFNNDIRYIDSGKYIPEIIKREDINDILLLPLEIKEKLINYLNKKNSVK